MFTYPYVRHQRDSHNDVLPQVRAVVVPLQVVLGRAVAAVLWHDGQLFALVSVVDAAVAKVIVDAAPHVDGQLRGDGRVAGVEERVRVRPQEEAVTHRVRVILRERLDVRGLQHGHGTLAGDGAAVVVGVGNKRAKGALTQAVFGQGFRVSLASGWHGSAGRWDCQRLQRDAPQTNLHLVQQPLGVWVVQPEGLAGDYGPPVARCVEPALLVKVEDVVQDDAPNLWAVLPRAPVRATAGNSLGELGQVDHAVFLPKGAPRPLHAHGQVLGEVPSAGDLAAVRGLHLEEEEAALADGLEVAAAGLPEVDLAAAVVPQVVVPGPVRDAHVDVHGGAAPHSRAMCWGYGSARGRERTCSAHAGIVSTALRRLPQDGSAGCR